MVTQTINIIEELKDNNALLLELIDLIPGHFAIKDKDGKYIATNFEIDLIGKTDNETPWKNEAPQIITNDKKVLQSKKEMLFTEKVKVDGKTLKTFASVKKPILDKNGNAIGLIVQAVEITEKK